MTNFNSESFNTHDRFSSLNSNSSLAYADFLFLDDSLFSESYKIKPEDYKSSDFPNSNLVDPRIVFTKAGYNSPPIPFIKYSKPAFYIGIVNIFSLLLTFVLALVTFANEISLLYSAIYIFLLSSVLGISTSILALRIPYSHFKRGYRLSRLGLIFSGFTLFIYVWVLLLMLF